MDLMITELLVDSIADALRVHDFKFFVNGDFNLNLIGLRNLDPMAGKFDDTFVCCYKVGGKWRLHLWPVTTDPGAWFLKNPINAQGTAILAHPQQCLGAYVIGSHRGYHALVQCKPVGVWRDDNNDAELDWGYGPGISGRYGINIHRGTATGITPTTNKYSAGCQAFKLRREFDALMDLARKSASIYGNKFTYTILPMVDVVNAINGD